MKRINKITNCSGEWRYKLEKLKFGIYVKWILLRGKMVEWIDRTVNEEIMSKFMTVLLLCILLGTAVLLGLYGYVAIERAERSYEQAIEILNKN